MRKLLLALAAMLACAIVVPLALSSSHREAPGIALDPSADNTDTYAWTAPGRARRADRRGGLDSGRGAGERAELPLVRRSRPLLHPCRQHGRRPAGRQLPVQLQDEGPQQGLVPVRAPGRERIRRLEAERHPALLGRPRDAPLPPRPRPREGEDGRTRPTGRAAQHRAEDVPELRQLRERGDPLAAATARSCSSASGTIRSSSTSARRSTRINVRKLTGNQGEGKDDLSGYNVHSIVMQLPERLVTRDRKAVSGPDASNAVVGVWSTTERRRLQVSGSRRGRTAAGCRSPGSATRW